MNIGELNRNDDGTVTGYIAEPTYDFEHVFLDRVSSASDRAPLFNIMTRSPRGRDFRLGAVWERAAKETGEVYFGGYIESTASGYVPLRLFRSRQNPHAWVVVRKTPKRQRGGAQEAKLPPPPEGEDAFRDELEAA